MIELNLQSKVNQCLKCNQNFDNSSDRLFENLGELATPQQVAGVLGLSVLTIYDWKYRGKNFGVPQEMFVKINNRRIYIRKSILIDWLSTTNKEV